MATVVGAYLVSAIVAGPLAGKLGDMFGHRRVMLSALLIFVLGSAGCGMATNMMQLILARGVQGAGGGAMMVLALSVVAHLAPGRELARYQGVVGAVFSVASLVGPLLTGVVLDLMSWRWLFLLNVPAGAIGLLAVVLVLERDDRLCQAPVDWRGGLLIGALMVSAVTLTNMIAAPVAPPFWLVLGLVAATAAAAALFVAVERRAADPFFPLALLANRNLTTVNLIGLGVGIGMYAEITFLPVLLQSVMGMSPSEAGFSMVPLLGTILVSSTAAGWLSARFQRFRTLLAGSITLFAGGLSLLALAGTASPLPLVWVSLVLMGLGLGPVMSLSITLGQSSVARSQLGAATASVSLFRNIGGVIGISVMGAIYARSGVPELLAGPIEHAASLRMIFGLAALIVSCTAGLAMFIVDGASAAPRANPVPGNAT